MANPFRILMVGGGTVGQALYRAVEDRVDELEALTGREFVFQNVVVRDLQLKRSLPGDVLTTDLDAAMAQPHDVLVELAGGVEGPREWIRESLACGIPVVTANKAVLALHGDELFGSATALRWEAAVAAGIPVVDTLQRVLAGNRVTKIQGVVNGTTNFILNQMEAGRTYADALLQAQQLGYAEADPTSDVDGFDPLYKISLLAGIVAGQHVPPQAKVREGIRDLDPGEMVRAKLRGETLRLVATAEFQDDRVELSVRPTAVPESHVFARLKGPENAVIIDGDLAGTLTLIGQGAGGEATASSVLGDLIIVAKESA